jgi:hypothetical protein
VRKLAEEALEVVQVEVMSYSTLLTKKRPCSRVMMTKPAVKYTTRQFQSLTQERTNNTHSRVQLITASTAPIQLLQSCCSFSSSVEGAKSTLGHFF